MTTDRPFSELNLWQHIFADHWDGFVLRFRETNGCEISEHWHENVERMLGCGDIREGYYEYVCGDCGTTTKIGFTCKSRLCLRCFKVAVDDWLKTAKKVLFEGVVHRQVVLTIPICIRALVLADEKFMKVFVDAGAKAVKGTKYEAAWYNRLGSMFKRYPTGFDCDAMPEKGPVERLVSVHGKETAN